MCNPSEYEYWYRGSHRYPNTQALCLRLQQRRHHLLLPDDRSIPDDDGGFLPDGVELEVALPVDGTAVDVLPVEAPYHLGEDDARLHITHVLADAAASAHGEGLEGRLDVDVEDGLVIRVVGRQPALWVEGARLVEVAR